MTSLKTDLLNILRLTLKNRVAERVLATIINGRDAKSWVARIPANYYQYEPGSFRAVTRNGFKYTLDLSEYMQWIIFYGIKAEPRGSLYSLLSPDMVVYDIGANIGETCLVFSRQCSAVYAFEPDPVTNARLKEHLLRNEANNVKAFELAIGNANHSVSLVRTAHNSGGNRITPDSQGVAIEVRRLDDLIAEQNLKMPSLIKIDVEGYEMQVLQGAVETIRTNRPVIFAEVSDQMLRRNNSSAQELIEFLQSAGYTIFRAKDGLRIDSPKNTEPHFDIIAKP
jgi:FkbM family methyltransferase